MFLNMSKKYSFVISFFKRTDKIINNNTAINIKEYLVRKHIVKNWKFNAHGLNFRQIMVVIK